MIALDTNVVVRLLAGDHPEQARRARKLVAGGAVLIPATVLVETEWVLRAAYGIEPSAIAKALRGLLGLPGVSTDSPAQVAQALGWFEEGMDFADALHVAASARATGFATFDERLIRAARRIGVQGVAAPPR